MTDEIEVRRQVRAVITDMDEEIVREVAREVVAARLATAERNAEQTRRHAEWRERLMAASL